MSTATTHPTTTAPPPFEVPGPVTRVPSLGELEHLTAIPERRVVYRGVDWSFYEQLVDSIPESSSIHVDYDGKDLEGRHPALDHRRRPQRRDSVGNAIARGTQVKGRESKVRQTSQLPTAR